MVPFSYGASMRISAEAEASYALLVSYRPLLHGNYFCSENLGNGLLCVQQKMGATLLKMAERFAGNSTAAAVRDTDKAELLRTLRVHATRRVAQHARAAATALEEGGCDGMVRFIAALAGYGEAGALGARDRDEATIA